MSSISAPSNNLNFYLTKNLAAIEKKGTYLEVKAFAEKTLATISLVAIVAIGFTVGLISLGVIAFPPLSVPVAIGVALALIVTSIALQAISNKYFNQARETKAAALIEKGVAQELQQINNWSSEELKGFYEKHQIGQIAHDLRPGIARYCYFQKLITERSAQEIKSRNTQTENDDLKYQAKNTAANVRDTEIFPAIVKAARMLQILRNPYSQQTLDSDKPNKLSYLARLIARDHGESLPPYIEQKQPITFDRIEELYKKAPESAALELSQELEGSA